MKLVLAEGENLVEKNNKKEADLRKQDKIDEQIKQAKDRKKSPKGAPPKTTDEKRRQDNVIYNLEKQKDKVKGTEKAAAPSPLMDLANKIVKGAKWKAENSFVYFRVNVDLDGRGKLMSVLKKNLDKLKFKYVKSDGNSGGASYKMATYSDILYISPNKTTEVMITISSDYKREKNPVTVTVRSKRVEKASPTQSNYYTALTKLHQEMESIHLTVRSLADGPDKLKLQRQYNDLNRQVMKIQDTLDTDFALAGIKRVVARLKVTALIKGADIYTWYIWQGKDEYMVTVDAKRQPILDKGDKFGLRPSSNGKLIRMVTEKDGITKVATIGDEEYKNLIKKSKMTKAP